jgi:hypothetical protein
LSYSASNRSAQMICSAPRKCGSAASASAR